MKLLSPTALLVALLVTACIQMPTEKQEVVDLIPLVAFALSDPNDDATVYRVFVDDLDMGLAANYAAGRNGLKVLSGTHIIRVEGRGKVVVRERVYLGDGAVRTILIPRP